MRKTLVALIVMALAACLSLAALTACGSSSNASSSEAAADADASSSSTTVLKVGFDQEFPPYGYVDDNGDYAGFDLDLAREVAARNGWDIELIPINWDAKDSELNSGNIDCIWNGFTIEGREDGYTWTDPYMDNTQVVVVRADSGINNLNDLAGKVVTTQADSAALNLLEEGGDQEQLADTFSSLLTNPDYNTAFMELESGAVDAIAVDYPVAYFQTNDRDDLIILEEPLSSEHFGVGFAQGNTKMRDQVEATLKEMAADGTVEQLTNKYGLNYDSWLLF